MFGFKNKNAQDRVRIADRRIQHLRDKREKTDDDAKKMQFNKKIHKYNVEKEIAMAELKHPRNENKTVNTNVNFNRTDKSKSVHFHSHYHKDK